MQSFRFGSQAMFRFFSLLNLLVQIGDPLVNSGDHLVVSGDQFTDFIITTHRQRLIDALFPHLAHGPGQPMQGGGDRT